MTYTQTPHQTTNVVVWYWSDPSNSNLSDIEHTDRAFDSVLQTIAAKGCEVDVKEKLDQVLDAVVEQTPDLLIVHLQASGEQGYQLCLALRQQEATKHLPVVFMGTRGTSYEWGRASRCGANDYLRMPAAPDECWLRLEHHMNTSRLVRQLRETRRNLTAQIEINNRILEQHKALRVSLTKENEELRQIAFTDELTQLDNRRSFNQNIAERWREAKDSGQRISLLLCDIDYFKRYNDTYGHPAGDACLRAVATALRQGVHRQQDQVARYGGEEFAIVLPNTDAEGAQKVAREVREAVARAQILHRGSLIKPFISLSIGISTLRPAQVEHCSYEELVKRADEALYNAKIRGRDRIFLNTAHPKRLANEKQLSLESSIAPQKIQRASKRYAAADLAKTNGVKTSRVRASSTLLRDSSG